MKMLKSTCCFSILFFCLQNYCLTVESLTKEGSEIIADNDFPSFASLMEFSVSIPVRLLCAGTVVTGVFVLSTASCMNKAPLDRTRVYLGRGKDLFTQEMGQYTYEVAWWMSYSVWARRQNRIVEDKDPDIAVLRLSRQVDFSDRVGLAGLPLQYDVPIHAIKVSLVGWKIHTHFIGNQHLLTGMLETKDMNFCKEYLKQPHLRTKLEEGKLFCTLPQPHLSTMDEGGPVFYDKRFLVGINYWDSYSKSRDSKNLHINILYYKDFVQHFILDPNPS